MTNVIRFLTHVIRKIAGDRGWLLALVLAAALVQTLRLWWRGARVRWRLRAQTARALAGEAAAEPLLRAHGYEVEARQSVRTWIVHVDGAPLEITLRADYLVSRGGRRLVADVKTGGVAPRLEAAATRRQLLEYRVAFDVDGVLLVDAESGLVREVEFALPGAPPPPLRWLIAGLLAGAAVGAACAAWW